MRELRRAWRTFWWMVVKAKPGQTLSRKTFLGIAVREARCGLITGGRHSWGPLRYEYEGAQWRKQSCRWCRSKRTPAEEIDRNPLSEAEQREAAKFMPSGPPSKEEVARALARAERAGVLRDGKFLWE